MAQRILVGCFEVPGWGGASTSAYRLFEMMQCDGLAISFLNIIASDDARSFRALFGDDVGNPRKLSGVWNCFLKEPTYFPHPELEDLIRHICPDIIVAVGWIAALLLKRAAPQRRVIYITSGCDQMKLYVEKYGVDFLSVARNNMNSEIAPFRPSLLEKETVESCDFIITHSDMNLALYRYFFPSFAGKIYQRVIWFAEWIYRDACEYASLAKPFDERDIDLIFIASDWTRPEKNFSWVRSIASRTSDLKVHVIGESNARIPNAEHDGSVTDRRVFFALLGRAKALACPSLFDAAPGILFEGAALGCNLVASRNCGNWSLCNEDLVADPFSLDSFVDKIRLAQTRFYADHMQRFLESGSYSDLVDTVLVF